MLNFSDISFIFTNRRDDGHGFREGVRNPGHLFFTLLVPGALPRAFQANQTAPNTNQITHSTFVIKHAYQIHLTDIYVPVAGSAIPRHIGQRPEPDGHL